MRSIKLSRRQALVAAGVAGVTTLLAGSAVLVAGAQGGAGTILRAGAASTDPAVVTEVQYDDTYAIVGDPPDASSARPRAACAGDRPAYGGAGHATHRAPVRRSDHGAGRGRRAP